MPFGVMIMLALYTVRGAGQADTRAGLALAVAVAATLGLRLRWRNPLLSILGGTVVHVVLATTLG